MWWSVSLLNKLFEHAHIPKHLSKTFLSFALKKSWMFRTLLNLFRFSHTLQNCLITLLRYNITTPKILESNSKNELILEMINPHLFGSLYLHCNVRNKRPLLVSLFVLFLVCLVFPALDRFCAKLCWGFNLCYLLPSLQIISLALNFI